MPGASPDALSAPETGAGSAADALCAHDARDWLSADDDTDCQQRLAGDVPDVATGRAYQGVLMGAGRREGGLRGHRLPMQRRTGVVHA
jgi:hypothetical protein